MAILADDVLAIALSFVGERAGADDLHDYFALPWLNLLLMEALPYENARRKKNGCELLSAAPQLKSWDEAIPYTEEICRIALPYGLASFIFQDDDNEYCCERYRNLYVNALREMAPLYEDEILDVYAAGRD